MLKKEKKKEKKEAYIITCINYYINITVKNVQIKFV